MKISEFVLKSNSRDQIMAFLGMEICPFGEVAGAGIGILESDGLIHFISSFGYSEKINLETKIKITSNTPSTLALRTMESQIFSYKQLGTEFSDVDSIKWHKTQYKMGVALPATTSVVYLFSFTSEIDRFKDIPDYFDCIRSTLAYWENMNRVESSMVLRRPFEGDPTLTERQEMIVSLMKDGHTNAYIGQRLGYSESLIRQESIIIYRKLGISGRKELIDNELVTSSNL